MPTQWSTFPIEFRGGLLGNLSPLQQGTNAVGSATVLQNFEPNKEGGYTKVKGFTKFDSAQVTGSGDIKGVKVVNSTKVVAARKNSNNRTQFFVSTGSGWTALTENTNGSDGGKVRHAEYNDGGTDKVIFVDGVNYPCIYQPSAFGDTLTHLNSTNSSDVEGAQHVAVFKNHVFYGKNNNLIFSDPYSLTSFGGVINVLSDITGLIVFRDQLFIFSENSIKRLSGNSIADFDLDPVTEQIGCLEADTIQEFGGDVIYLAPDGIRTLSATDRIGDFGLDIPSDSILKEFKDFTEISDSYCSLVLREKAQYRLFNYTAGVKAGTARGLIATKCMSQGGTGISWGTTRGVKARVADGKYVGNAELFIIGNDTGYVYKYNTGSNYDGSAINAIYESPYMPISDPEVRKTFYKLTLYAEPTGNMIFDVKLRYNFASSGDTATVQPDAITIENNGNTGYVFSGNTSLYGSATYGVILKRQYPLNVQGSGYTVSIRIEDNSSEPSYTLDTALLEFSNRDRK